MAGLVIKPRARIFHGHDWVYSSEVQKAFGDPQPGDVISLKNFKDRPLGTAIYNPASQIVARRISRRKQDLDRDFFVRRLTRAREFRDTLNLADPCYRLVWSESDGLPGVIIDRYGDHFVLQTLTLAMDQRKALIVEALIELFSPASIVERNDMPIRNAEDLPQVSGVLHGDAPAEIPVSIDGLQYRVELLEGQKTGLYLDQFDNYAAVGKLCADRRVLDCFCNQGGFALHAARGGATSVEGIDSSSTALAAAAENAERNELKIDWTEANVFDFLKQAESEKREFDLIVLDPPSFTRNRKSVRDALRGYKEIHLRAMRLLTPGGILSTYCCSHHVSRPVFFDTIKEAAVDAKRTLRVIDTHTQRRDHPVIATLPETEYLKGFTFQLVPAW